MFFIFPEKNIHLYKVSSKYTRKFLQVFLPLRRHLTKISTSGEQQFDGFEIEVSCGAQRGD
jgi:hypothetical protein